MLEERIARQPHLNRFDSERNKHWRTEGKFAKALFGKDYASKTQLEIIHGIKGLFFMKENTLHRTLEVLFLFEKVLGLGKNIFIAEGNSMTLAI